MWYCYVISFLLHWAALSSYWRWVNKTKDVEALNWFLHGFGIGLAMLPMLFLGYNCYMIVLRAFILGDLMMWWSEKNDNVVKEEFGRGFLIIVTLGVFYAYF